MNKFTLLAVTAAAVLFGVGGCVSSKIVMTPEKGLVAARALEKVSCETLIDLHARQVVVGPRFNEGKKLCIKIDSELNVADGFLKVGKVAEAVLSINQAQSDLAQVPKE